MELGDDNISISKSFMKNKFIRLSSTHMQHNHKMTKLWT